MCDLFRSYHELVQKQENKFSSSSRDSKVVNWKISSNYLWLVLLDSNVNRSIISGSNEDQFKRNMS